MTDLHDHLAAYGARHDEWQEPVTLDAVFARVSTAPALSPLERGPVRRHRPVLIAIAAFIALAVVIGVPVLLLRLGPEQPADSVTTTLPAQVSTTVTDAAPSVIRSFVWSQVPAPSSAVGELHHVGVLDGAIVLFEAGVELDPKNRGVYTDLNGDPHSYLHVSEDGTTWARRPLPESTIGRLVSFVAMRDFVYVVAYSDAGDQEPWMTRDRGATWERWGWTEPNLDMDGLVIQGPSLGDVSSHHAWVGDTLFFWIGDAVERTARLRIPDDTIQALFGVGATAAQQSDQHSFTVERDGEFVAGLPFDVEVVGREMVVSVFESIKSQRAGIGPIHVGRLVLPPGVDPKTVDRLREEQPPDLDVPLSGFLGIPGMWRSDNGTLFEWVPVTGIDPYEVGHLRMASGSDFAVGVARREDWFADLDEREASPEEIWRLDRDGSWTLAAQIDVEPSTRARVGLGGDVVALLDGGVLSLSRDGGATFEVEREFSADFGSVVISAGHVFVMSGNGAWVGSLESSEWTWTDFPARPNPRITTDASLTESGGVTDSGTIILARLRPGDNGPVGWRGGQWWIGSPS